MWYEGSYHETLTDHNLQLKLELSYHLVKEFMAIELTRLNQFKI